MSPPIYLLPQPSGTNHENFKFVVNEPGLELRARSGASAVCW